LTKIKNLSKVIMKKNDKQMKLFNLLIDAMLDDKIVVWDMKGRSLKDVVDVNFNGGAVQLTINPVIARKRGKK
jgi:mRNA-degrading endonuclease HigB of HigAB toxin-antitoxin module